MQFRVYADRLRAHEPDALTRPITAQDQAAALDELIGEYLIEREAERVRTPPPKGAEIGMERARFEAGIGGAAVFGAFTRKLGISEREVGQVVRRRAAVSAFLRANLEGTTEVTEAQVRRAFDAEDHPFKGMSFDAVKDPLRVWMRQRTLDRAVARWVSVLEGRLPVRRLLVPAPATPNSEPSPNL
ncbi:MAG: hypothetical protein R3A78_05680 [Polyangiales bacterium]